MKVAMITDTYDGIGGTEQAIKNFSSVLEGLGHQVRIIHSDKRYRIKGPLEELLRFNPDIVHVHTPGPLGNLGVLYAKSKEVPVLGYFHSLPDVRFYFERGLEKKTIGEFLWKLVKYFYQSCDLTLVPTKEVERLLREKGFENLRVLHYGIDLSLFKPVPDGDVRRSLHFGDRDRILLYTGWFRKDKRVDVLLRSLKQLDEEFKLLLIGDGPTRADLLKEISSLGISDRVAVHASVENSELAKFYNCADIYVNASMSETLGISMVEAMACGLPVVAAASPGAKDIITPGYNGLLAGLDSPRSLAEGVEGLWPRRKEMGINARQAIGRYDVRKTTRRLAAIYEEALGF